MKTPKSSHTSASALVNVSTEQELRDLLRSKKLRVTSVRLAVLTVLHDRKGPMNHEEIMQALEGRAFDKASVWRILSELSDKALLRRMDLGDRVWRYELVDKCRTIEAQHPHFLCLDCGDVACLPTLTVRAGNGELPTPLKSAKFRVRLEGTCAACA